MFGWGNRYHVNKRSMNADLTEGMTDGCDKKIVRNHGGIVEETTAEARRELNEYYHFQEAPPNYHEPVPNFVKVRQG